MHISSIKLVSFFSTRATRNNRSSSQVLNASRNTCAAIKNPSPRTVQSRVNLHPKNSKPIQFYKATNIILVRNKPFIDCAYLSHFRKTLEPAIIMHGSKEGRLGHSGNMGDAASVMTRLEKTNPLIKSNLYETRRSPDKNKLHVVACSAGAAGSSSDKIASGLEITTVSYGKGIIRCGDRKNMPGKANFYNKIFSDKIYYPFSKTPKIHEPSS